MLVDISSSIFTVNDYWDCECLGNDYIHSKIQMLCFECGSHQDEQPDSRLDEVLRQIVNYLKEQDNA